MNVVRQLALLALAVCSGLVLAGCQPSTKTASAQPTLTSVAFAPASATVTITGTQPLVLTGTFSDSSTLDLTSAAAFSSDNLAVATVSSFGIVRAISSASTSASGVAHITGLVNGKAATATITVPPPALVSIGIAPKGVPLFVGGSQPLSVRAIYDQGSSAALTSGVTFVSDHPNIATVSGSGVVTAVTTGTAIVTATDTVSGRSDTTIVTVTVAPVATLLSISATPTSVSLAPAATQQLTVKGTFSNGAQVPLAPANETFVSSNPAIASVDAAGLVTAHTAGTVSIAVTDTASGLVASPSPSVTVTAAGWATITFDDLSITYGLTDFGGVTSSVVADPTGGSNKVTMVVKPSSAQPWGGTTVSTVANASVPVIPLTASVTKMTLRVYSPGPGIHVRLKAEDAADPTHSVETEALTTLTNTWETLTFDFASQAAGTAALNPAFTFDRLSLFFDFNTVPGATETFYFDDLALGAAAGGGGGGAWSPITFDSASITYTLTDFGGVTSSVVTDPTGGSNKVTMVQKPASAQPWGGTTVSTGANASVPTIPLSASVTTMTVRVYSPGPGIHVRLKAEDAADPTHSVETEALTTLTNAWETLTFNFANQAAGTAALNPAFTFNKLSLFFDFLTVPGATETFYFDDITLGAAAGGGGGGGGGGAAWAAITFDNAALTYTTSDFGGVTTTIVTDPAGGSNKVGMLMKPNSAAPWGGVTVSTGANFSVPTIPLTASRATMTVRVYSAGPGFHIRLKAEDAADPTHSVETEALTTLTNTWETLSFNFLNQAAGTAQLNPAFTFNKTSLFFDFNTTPAATETFYFDDISFP